MFDLGEEEVTIESYRIPWLIWIQLIVLFLLLLILFSFTLLPLDPHHDDATTVLPATSTTNNDIHQIGVDQQPLPNHDSTPILVTNHTHQGGQRLSIKGEIATSSSMRREEITEGEASSLNFHPCHYFELATVAFLKCFGLDSRSDAPSTRRLMKRKES